MATELDSGTLLVGAAAILVAAYWLRTLEFRSKDDVHRLRSPVMCS